MLLTHSAPPHSSSLLISSSLTTFGRRRYKTTDSPSVRHDEAIYRLAESMQPKLIQDAGSNMNTHHDSSTSTLTSTSTSTSNNSAPNTNIQQGINGGGSSISTDGGKNQHDQNPSIEEICTVLKELQSHAIQKLNEKNSISIKILASKPHFSSLFIGGTLTLTLLHPTEMRNNMPRRSDVVSIRLASVQMELTMLIWIWSGLLGFDCTANNSEHGSLSFEDKQSTSTLIVIGLLRISNNSIDQALELYNSAGADQILLQVVQLDEASGRKKRQSADSKKPAAHEVQDVDLTMLVSMGVDESRARDALKFTGNFESAILWLSKEDESTIADDTKAGDDTSAPDHKITSDSDEDAGNTTSIDDAFDLLERELVNALGADSKQLLEKEWLGVDMQDEWNMIQKYM